MSRQSVPPKRILVTGAAGFIGFHTCRRFLDRGAAVLGVDCLTPYYDVALKASRRQHLERQANFEFASLDLVDRAAFIDVFRRFQPDAVVHLAAQVGVRHSLADPGAYTRNNIEGFLSVIEACRAHPVGHLIYASSSSVYGANTTVPFRETDPVDLPISLYSATKRANEMMARSYAHLFGIPMSGLRFFTVYGPWGRPDMAYFSFTKAILEGRGIDVFNGGEVWRDFTYIDDVTAAIGELIGRPPTASLLAEIGSDERVPHVIYNVGNQTQVKLDDFIAEIERATGCRALKIMQPMQAGDVARTFADTSRLKQVTGFAPHTPLDEGIKRFVAWYRDYYKLPAH